MNEFYNFIDRLFLKQGAMMSLFTDFDHYDMPLGPDGTPYEYFERIRDESLANDTPIGWSERHGGFWVVASWEENRAIQANPDIFSSSAVTFPRYAAPGGKPFMITSMDDPEHRYYRSMVQGPFTPERANDMARQIRVIVNELIDTIITSGRADVCSATDLLPVRATAVILGLPLEDAPKYRRFVDAIVTGATDPESAAPHIREMEEYVRTIILERRGAPVDGLLSEIINTEYKGQGLNDEEIIDIFTVLLLGGIDNTARFLGNVFYRLAWNKELRRQLARKPEMIPTALEEFLRLDGPASIFRMTRERVDIKGVTMEPGDIVGLIHQISNRDSRQFDHPDVFIPDRSPNKHFALGHGVHRCLGMHLARVESKLMIEEFLRRIPEFELDHKEKAVWVSGQVGAMHHVPIVFQAGSRES